MIQLEFNRKKNCRLKDILSQKKGGEGMGERKKKEEKMDSQNRWTGADTLWISTSKVLPSSFSHELTMGLFSMFS